MPSPRFAPAAAGPTLRDQPADGSRRSVPPRSSDAGAWVIALEGDVGIDAITRVETQIADALRTFDGVWIDLRDVTVLGTPALAMLCTVLRRVRQPGRTISIVGVCPAAHRALALCDLAGVHLNAPHTTHGDATDPVAIGAPTA